MIKRRHKTLTLGILPKGPEGHAFCRVIVAMMTVVSTSAYAGSASHENPPNTEPNPGPYGILQRNWPPATPQPAATSGETSAGGNVVFAPPALPREDEALHGLTAPSDGSAALSPPQTSSRLDAILFAPPTAVPILAARPLPSFPNAHPDPEPAARPSSETIPQSASRALVDLPRADPAEIARLKARARELLDVGQIAPARAVLADAATGGDGEASYMLAQTYDGAALVRAGVLGVAPDQGKADALYDAARRAGYPGK